MDHPQLDETAPLSTGVPDLDFILGGGYAAGRRTDRHEQTIREYRIEPSGIRVGPPLNRFHGVLTGLPSYDGETGSLMSE